jgi:hypothetical protein
MIKYDSYLIKLLVPKTAIIIESSNWPMRLDVPVWNTELGGHTQGGATLSLTNQRWWSSTATPMVSAAK